MRSDIKLVLAAFAVGRVVADTTLVPAYAQCGGDSWLYGFECEAGYSCISVGKTTLPAYLCEPTGGPYTYPAPNWTQCGGQGFTGPKVCATGWHCQFQTDWNSQCLKDDDFVIPPRPVDYPWPTFKAPGDKCGDDKVGPPFSPCTPGFSCKVFGLWTWWVCLADDKPITSTPAATTKATTTSVYYPPSSTLKTTPVGPTPPVKPTTKATTTAATTKATTTATTTKTTTRNTSLIYEPGPTAPLWGQCGGMLWAGPIGCTPPSVCKVANIYFSQCLLP